MDNDEKRFNRIWKILEKTSEDLDKLKESQKKTNEQIKELREAQKKTDEEIEKVNKQVGELTGGWGKVVEGMVLPSAEKEFSPYGSPEVYQNAKSSKDGRNIEIDIILISKDKEGKSTVYVIEAKSHLKGEDVNDFLEDLKDFKQFFTPYKSMDVIGVIAGIRTDMGVDKFVEKSGLYLLAPSGDMMVLKNSKGFKPKVW